MNTGRDRSRMKSRASPATSNAADLLPSRFGMASTVPSHSQHGHVTVGINMAEEKEKQLARRRCELELISSLDKRSITDYRKDCWYLMDSKWLTAWTLYAAMSATTTTTMTTNNVSLSEAPAPGPVSTMRLVQEDGRTPLTGLKAVEDYRGVPSLVYFCFVELHGRDDKFSELPRYEVDIYKPEVRAERLVPIVDHGQTAARILVDELRPQWITWERHYSDDEYDDNEEIVGGRCCSCCFGGFTREHIESLIYWAVLCCTRASRKKSGRKDVSYRQYNPMRYREGDSTRGFDDVPSVHGDRGGGNEGGGDGDDGDGDGEGDVDVDTQSLSTRTTSLSSSSRSSISYEHGRSYFQPMLPQLFGWTTN